MTDRIVSFRGGPEPSAAAPRDDVIEMLEAALERARSGQLQTAVLVTMDHDRKSGFVIKGLIGAWSILGAMRMADRDLVGLTAEANRS